MGGEGDTGILSRFMLPFSVRSKEVLVFLRDLVVI